MSRRTPKSGPLCVSALAFALLATLFASTPTRLIAAPIGLMERFALADDREAILAELIPGSPDYFFFHCLHYQNTRQLDRAEATLKDWIASRKGNMTASMHAMMDRQRLLTYDRSPKQTIDYLVKRLGVQLSHSPPVKKGTRRYPTRLAENFIDLDRLLRDSLRDNVHLSPLGMQMVADQFLAGQQLPISLKDFLKRVQGSYLVGLDRLVIKEIQSRRARDQRFGDLPAHKELTLEELNAVGRALPTVTDDNDFVNAKLRMLRPDDDVDLSQQPEARRQYLIRVESYVRGLPASYNSLKASAAYRLLEANLAAGVWDRALFMRYLQLPRQSPLISPMLAQVGSRADLRKDYTGIAILPPIGNEQTLVETYLEHFLRDAKDTDAFQAYLQPDFLRRVFARTKLMAGVADPEPFYKMLSASERQQLRDLKQLRFSPQNPRTFATDQPTQLLVDIKNIDELVVRIYEMNTLSYYRANQKRLDTDVDLDGLIATHERTIEYDRPPIEKHRESIALGELKGRGVWIVDLVGKGLRARTLIRRGDLQTVRAHDANGMQLTVLDENRNAVPGAKVLVGNQEFSAGEDGRVFLPMVNKTTEKDAIVYDGTIAKKTRLIHLGESYSLIAGFHVERSLLQTGRMAKLIVRPKLTLGHVRIDPATLGKASVRIVATDLEGIETTKQFDDVKLDQAEDLVLSFRVPPRLSKLKFELTGSVVGLSDRRIRELSTRGEMDVAGIRKTTQTLDAFLTRDGDNYVIETRGRTGEAVAGATVFCSFHTVIGSIEPSQLLQSDDNGRVTLGPLKGVERLNFGIADKSRHSMRLNRDGQTWPSRLNLAAGELLRLPLVDGREASDFRLLQWRAGGYRSDLSDQLKVAEGFLTSQKLSAGDYRLIQRRSGYTHYLTVVDGQNVDGVLAGKIRHREQRVQPPLSIRSVTRNDDGGLSIQLSGDSGIARVHLIAGRYFDFESPLNTLFLSLDGLSGRQLSLARSGYVGDLRLGDEYEYVLRRQYAAKYPGVMLPQPSILLNPWETETTSNASQAAQAGDMAPASAVPEMEARMRQGGGRAQSTGGNTVTPDFDFLSDSGTVVGNLKPDKNGSVTIPGDLIKGLPLVRIVVSDPMTLLQKTVVGESGKVETEDLRLAESLPVDQPFSFERTVSVVSDEDPLDLATLGSAQVQVYGDVASLLSFYLTLVGDERLAEFQVLGVWHTLTPEQKLASYSELACHELHVFLRLHDREFFDAVIRPYLKNKKEKQFLDRWLLDEDLTAYTTLWKYRRLSAAERALLAIRMPGVRDQIRRDLAESVALMKEDFEAVRKQVESALRSSGMEDAFAIMDMDAEVAEGEVRLSRQAGTYAFDSSGALGFAGGAFGANAKGAPARQLREKLEAKLSEVESLSDHITTKDRFLRRRSLSLADKQLSFYQQLDSTKQWAESNWDRVRVVGGPSPYDLIPINPFWNDLASDQFESDGLPSPSVSPYLLRCTNNRHAALMALALSGLPLQSGDIALPAKPETVYRPEHAVALVTKRLRTLKPAGESSPVLIGQLFRSVDAPKDQAADPSRFATGQAYLGQVVVSNPTPTEQLVELFWQIPAGSLPLGGSQVTDSKTVKLAPFAVTSVSYQFYFPTPGEFVHYPATVSGGDQLLARGNEKTFEVLESWSDDAVTWKSIARTGTPDQMREFLAKANLNEIDWSEVLHRMKDRKVYDAITQVVGDARLPAGEVWGYGFHHGDVDAVQTYLSLRQDLISRAGPALASSLLTIDAVEQRQLEHLEYAPLVRARIHRLGKVDEILNPTFLGQYQQFTRRLGFKASVDSVDKMPLAYYLLLQNRIEEAIQTFDSIDRSEVDSQLQYDYLAGYLAMHQSDYETALAIADSHQNHPVPRWQGRFAEMASQVRQRFELMDAGQLISAGGDTKPIDSNGVSVKAADLAIADRDRANSQASAAVPEVIARVEDDVVRIDHRNADQVDLHFYGVDLELLFSKAPFARKDLKRIAMVRPTRSDTVTMKTKTGTGRVPIPPALRSQTLLVEARVGASQSTTLYYGGNLTTYVSEAFGQLQTTDAESHRPVAGAYVKVYARYPDGNVRFYKDGYTDGRGRFDYTSISAADAQGAERYAILVLSDDKGATLHDVAAP